MFFNLLANKIFLVLQGDRTYSMEDPNSDALEWIKAIDEMHQAVFGQKAVSS